MPKHFTKEFEDEAVRLATTSGATRKGGKAPAKYVRRPKLGGTNS